MSQEFIRRWHEATPGTRSSKVYISADDLQVLVAKSLKGKLDKKFTLYTADSQFYCPPLADARQIIDASTLDRKTWAGERFDCDDFALVLKSHFAEAAYADGKRRAAHCFGIVWGMLPDCHAINWMVTNDLELLFIEPQSDKIFSPRASDKDIWFMLV